MREVLLMVVIGLAPAAQAAAAGNPELERARELLEALKFSDAQKPLEAAWELPGNDRETVLEILKLQAVVAASLGQTDKAKTFFRNLVYLAPDFVLPEGDLGPKIMSLFYEAKGRVAADTALKVEALPTIPGVNQLGVQVKADPLKLGKKVRFHTRGADAAWKTDDIALANELATLPFSGASVEWWAQLLGDAERVLWATGSADQPLHAVTVAVASAPAVVAPSPPMPTLRKVSWGLLSGGAAAGIGGLVFGLASNSARSKITGATRDDLGRVTSLTRVEGLTLNRQVASSATVANVLFVSAAALAGTGVTLFFLSRDVAVTASPAGIAVGGALP